jgi:hypothetical protein
VCRATGTCGEQGAVVFDTTTFHLPAVAVHTSACPRTGRWMVSTTTRAGWTTTLGVQCEWLAAYTTVDEYLVERLCFPVHWRLSFRMASMILRTALSRWSVATVPCSARMLRIRVARSIDWPLRRFTLGRSGQGSSSRIGNGGHSRIGDTNSLRVGCGGFRLGIGGISCRYTTPIKECSVNYMLVIQDARLVGDFLFCRRASSLPAAWAPTRWYMSMMSIGGRILSAAR